MRFLARFAMRGPYFAAAVAAAFVLGPLSIGPLLVLSGAIVVLVTLRQGAYEGMRVVLIASVFALTIRFALTGDIPGSLILCAMTWLPAWCMALVLRAWPQQAAPLLFAALLTAIYAASMRIAIGDVTAFWSGRFAQLLDLLAREGESSLTAEQLDMIARQLHTWSVVAILNVLVGMVLLGRWWQSVLFNPEGFGAEFRELNFPRSVLGILLAVGLAFVVTSSASNGGSFVSDALVILVVLFAFQGLAVIHFRARVVKIANGWLVAMYALLMLMPQVVGPLLATAGVADTLGDFRRLRGPRNTV